MACIFCSAAAWASGDIFSHRERNGLAIEQPLLSQQLEMVVIQAVGDGHHALIPPIIARFVAAEQ
jgi:hypothetical protein